MTRQHLNDAFTAFRHTIVVNSVIGAAGVEVVNHLERGLVALEDQLAADLNLTWDTPADEPSGTAEGPKEE